MKIVNGKLIDRSRDDSDLFKEKIEEIYYLQQILEKRIQVLENNRLKDFEQNLAILKQYIPTKWLWFTFYSFLTIGFISLFSLLKFELQHKCKSTREPIKISILPEQNPEQN